MLISISPKSAPAHRKRLRWIVAGLTIGIGALLVWGARFWLEEPGGVPFRMPDGAPAHVMAVTYGNQHRYVIGRRFQQILAPSLPPSLSERLGGMSLFSLAPPSHYDSLGLWVNYGKNDFDWTTRITTVDEAGNEGADLQTDSPLGFGSPPTPGAQQNSIGWNGFCCWQAPVFSRRARTLRFRLYAGQKGTRGAMSDFSLPNPLFRTYPSWKPEPLPATRVSGPLTVSLVRLEWGVSPSKRKTRALPGEKGWTRAVFRVRERGKPTGAWLVNQVVLSDATGNTTPTDFSYSLASVDQLERDWDLPLGDEEELWPDVLWPGEAWSVRAELVPVRSFPRERVLVLRRIPLPCTRGSQTITIPSGPQATAQTGQIRVQLFSVEQHEPQDANFDVEISGLAPNQRLTILRPTKSGYEWSEGGGMRNGRQSINAWTGSGAKTFDLCLGIEQARTVEFIAQPSISPSPRPPARIR